VCRARARRSAQVLVVARKEANPSLLVSYRGSDEDRISPKWNVKIYKFNHKKRGHSIVCVDNHVLEQLMADENETFTPSDRPVLRIDDAGWGFPLCGVMVGVSDEQDVRWDVVPVEYFRHKGPKAFTTGRYLHSYTERALRLVGEAGAFPETHRIEICSGFVNQPVREALRARGYEVRVVEIRGLLQDELERIYKDYVHEEIGADIYYDPKEIKRHEIPQRYHAALEYGRRRCPHLLKTGWRSMSEGASRT
jgi:hypothetical protein